MIIPDADSRRRDAAPASAPEPKRRFSRRWEFVAKLIALFTIVVGARLWLIHLYSSAVPFWDQWEEAKRFLQPWLAGTLDSSVWFAPHNEHRMFCARVLEALLVGLNKQWDPHLQMTVNAGIVGLIACTLAVGLRRVFGAASENLLIGSLAVVFALPFGSENTLWAFQVQLYLMMLFSFVAIFGLGFHRPGSVRWVVGLVFAVLSIFTTAAGVLASVVVAGLVIFRALRHRKLPKPALVTLGAALLVVGIGIASSNTPEGYERVRADSVASLILSAGKNLAWPFVEQPVLCLVTLLPLPVVLVVMWRRRWRHTQNLERALALGLWTLLQGLAMAYGRGIMGTGPTSRYMDTLCLGVIAGLAAILVMLRRGGWDGGRTLVARGVSVAWCGLMLYGCVHVSQSIYKQFTLDRKMTALVMEMNTRAFVATDNESHLRDKPTYATPFPGNRADDLIQLLRNPEIQAVLPAVCRPPLIASIESGNGGFQRLGFGFERLPPPFEQGWGSSSPDGRPSQGSFVSQPFTPKLPVLRFQVCAHPSADGLKLNLVSASGRRIPVPLEGADQWRTVMVPVGTGPLRLEAGDMSGESWLGFTDFREMGWWSWQAERVLALWPQILMAGLVLMGGLVFRDAWVAFQAAQAVRLADVVVLALVLGGGVYTWNHRLKDERTFTGQCQAMVANQLLKEEQFSEAARHYRQALATSPDDPALWHNLSLSLMAVPGRDPNGALFALQCVRRASDLAGGQNLQILDTLATIYAEIGEYPQAVQTAARCIGLAEQAGQVEFANAVRAKLEFYKLGKPYRPQQ